MFIHVKRPRCDDGLGSAGHKASSTTNRRWVGGMTEERASCPKLRQQQARFCVWIYQIKLRTLKGKQTEKEIKFVCIATSRWSRCGFIAWNSTLPVFGLKLSGAPSAIKNMPFLGEITSKNVSSVGCRRRYLRAEIPSSRVGKMPGGDYVGIRVSMAS